MCTDFIVLSKMQDVIKCAFTCIPDWSNRARKRACSSSLKEIVYRIFAGSFFSGRPVFFNCFLLFSFITNPFLIHTKTPTSEDVFCSLQGQVVLSIGNLFEMLKTQLAVFR